MIVHHSINGALYFYSILYIVDICDYGIDELRWPNCPLKLTLLLFFFIIIINKLAAHTTSSAGFRTYEALC
jgi:hypothetical protein